MKQPSTFGLTLDQLRKLCTAAREPGDAPDPGEHDAKKELLTFRLAQTLPLDKQQTEALPEVLSLLCRAMGDLTGDAIGEIIKHPSSDLPAIKRIKRYSKKLASKAASKPEHDVHAAIYYAAIAHALVFHQRRITRFSYPVLTETYTRLINEPWISQDLLMLFKLAKAYCREKAASS